jgi:FixJ family two-component response regulator
VLTVQTHLNADGAVQVCVADSGPGIRPADLPRLFEAFYSTKEDGMGMGLPICRSIIENHGGRIWAKPSAPDSPVSGAAILFTLPVMQTIDYSDSLVYIVDDEAPLRDAISSLLRSVGMQVASYGSVADFPQPRREVTSCLLLDVRMPGVSGLDFQAELNREGVTLPIIFMTGHGDIPMSVRAMKAGAVDFLAKPFRDQDLLDAIHAALATDRERQRDQASSGIKARYATLTPREREIMALARAA